MVKRLVPKTLGKPCRVFKKLMQNSGLCRWTHVARAQRWAQGLWSSKVEPGASCSSFSWKSERFVSIKTHQRWNEASGIQMLFLFLFLKVEWEPDRARARRPGPQSQPIRNMHDRVSSLEYWVYIWCVICRFQAWTVFLAKAQSRAQTKLGSFHLPSQRRQKWKSGLKIS